MEQVKRMYDNKGKLTRVIIDQSFELIRDGRKLLTQIEEELMEEEPDKKYIEERLTKIIVLLGKGFTL